MINIPKAKLDPIYRLIGEGKLDQADVLARRLVTQHPRAPHALDVMRLLAQCRHDHTRAVHYARRMVEVVPTDARARADLAVALARAREPDEAISILRALVAELHHEEWPDELLATTLFEAGRLVEAEAAGREGLARHPSSGAIALALSSALLEQGRGAEGVEVLHQALRRNPSNDKLAGLLACTMNYDLPVEPARILSAHQNWGRLLEMMDLHQPFKHTPPAAGAARVGPLRVGFLSSDLRRHSVASFIEPILTNLAPSRVRPLCYMTLAHADDVTERLGALAQRAGGALRSVADLAPSSLAATLHADRLDVLIELNGLTLGNSLASVRLRPAPVQITFCGYPATTGLRVVDYRLVDSITDPPGHERWMTERPLRLDPCFLCYQPPQALPADSPARHRPPDHAITFGSFNNMLKVNDAVVDAWSALLAHIPGARLTLKGRAFSAEPARLSMVRRFQARGIDPSRVHPLPPITSAEGHLAAYAEVDVALDTFPYTGTTTTCEALFMGVPVVTLCPPPDQSMHAGRVSASLLRAVGLDELIAPTIEDYLRLAARLAGDPACLAEYRRTLRPRLLASPLCDASAYTRRFEALLEHAWAQWAGGGR